MTVYCKYQGRNKKSGIGKSCSIKEGPLQLHIINGFYFVSPFYYPVKFRSKNNSILRIFFLQLMTYVFETVD